MKNSIIQEKSKKFAIRIIHCYKHLVDNKFYTLHGLVLCMTSGLLRFARKDDCVFASEAKQSRENRMHKIMPREV
jgi:hypothetical protein